MLEKTWNFVCYWYFRYCMVTELYMVERWEQALINGFMILLFFLLFYFNYAVLLKAVSYLVPQVADDSFKVNMSYRDIISQDQPLTPQNAHKTFGGGKH
ncbi:hypothetical protein J437_LFUL015127 [Ladona fulva]|uniref:Serine palmitoyltransferase small subunit B n=1 Tax=Ladona fulva TaxID=123851 RepID=A0A8K0KH23_LADFU|nr:hypothetical protein J437_LFUL015127 [Ladona fulva]